MMTPIVASKLAEANHPVACPTQWLPVLLASDPVPPTHRRRLFDNVFTSKTDLKTAVDAYDANADSAIATYGAIADWDVSAVTDMSGLFEDLKNFNADISNWDTSGVTTMYLMFYGASAFNQPLSFDTSSVTDMRAMFEVRSSPCPAPNLQSSTLLHAACRICPPCDSAGRKLLVQR